MPARLTRRQLLLLGAALPVLHACGRGAATPATLRVFLPLDPYERSIVERQILPPFERHRGVQVQLEGGTGAEAIERLLQEQRAGQPTVDLLAIDVERLGELVAAGAVQELEAVRPRLPGGLIPSLLPALESAGRLVALPLRPAVWVTFYNAPLLAGRGPEPPATWDALLAAAGALRGSSGEGLVALQGSEGGPAAQSLVELVWAFGGDPLRLDDEGSHAAATYLQRLAPHLAPASATAKFDTMTAALAGGRVALGPNWAVVAADLLQRGGKRDIAVYPGPVGPAGRGRLVSGQVLVVPRGATQREHALALAEHLWSAEVQRLLAGQLAWTPLRADAFDAAPEWQRPVAAATLEAVQTACALPPLRDRYEFDAILGEAFRAIAFEGGEPQTALARAAARLQALS